MIRLSHTQIHIVLLETIKPLIDYVFKLKVLSDSAGGALGAIIAKSKHVRDIGYRTYTKLYDCGVSPVLDYTGEVWGFKDKSPCNKIT